MLVWVELLCGQVTREVRPQGGSWIWLVMAVSYFPSLKLIFLTCEIERIIEHAP